MQITIAKDFSETPGGRFISEGEFSGELFRDKQLYPAYERCLSSGEKLIVDFDGCFGFGTSFLEEAFGGMVRKYHLSGILDNIILLSMEDETIPGLIQRYVQAEERKLR